MTVTGVRWAESSNRRNNQGAVTIMGKKVAEGEIINTEYSVSPKHGSIILNNDNEESRRLVESCYKRHRTTLNPIIDWSDRDVWGFINSNKISYCELYNEGFHRLGCIGCPLSGTKGRAAAFIRWPKYKHHYLVAFEKMLEVREQRGLATTSWDNAKDVFNWWMDYDILPGQMNWFEDFEEEE